MTDSVIETPLAIISPVEHSKRSSSEKEKSNDNFTLTRNFDQKPITNLSWADFDTTYTLTNESWDRSLKQLSSLEKKGTIKQGQLIAVGASGIQLGLIANYGHHFEKICLFDNNPLALGLVADMLSPLQYGNISWEQYWQKQFGVTEQEANILNYYFTLSPQEFSTVHSTRSVIDIELRLLDKAMRNNDLRAKLGYELCASKLINRSGITTVYTDVRENHPLTNPVLFYKFINNCKGKEIVLEQKDILSTDFKLPVTEQGASVIYTNGLLRYSRAHHPSKSFKDISTQILTSLTPYISPETIVVEQGREHLWLRAAPFTESVLRTAAESDSFEDTHLKLGI